MKEVQHRATFATEALLLEALAAYRAWRDAEQGGAPMQEVYRLGLLAEPLLEAVLDLRLLAISGSRESRH